MLENNPKTNIIKEKLDEEIDLSEYLKLFIRSKKILMIFTIIGIIIGYFSFLSQKKVWQGEFQIVLSSTKSSNINNPALPQNILSIIQGDSSQTSLGTEIEILKSPSVLFEVFEFVKNKKDLKGSNVDNMRFINWYKSSLDISRQPGTTILNIKYRDIDKEIIIDSLNKIAERYQNFSLKDNQNRIDEGITFLEDQIKIFKTKSSKSYKDLQEFGIENNIYPSLNSNETSSMFLLESEERRIQAEKKLDLVKKYLKEFSQLKDQDEIRYNLVLSEINPPILKEIEKLDSEIAAKKAIYTDKDPNLKLLIAERDGLIMQLKEDIYGSLNSQQNLLNAQAESSERSKALIIKFKELSRKAIRDEKTLIELERRYQEILLTKARTLNPWELITSPTISDIPYSPSLPKNILLFSFIGFFIGLGLLIRKTIIEDLIIFEKYAKNTIGYEKLFSLFLDKKIDWDEYIKLLAMGHFKSTKSKKIYLIPIGEIPSEIMKNISDLFNKNLKGFQIISTTKITEIDPEVSRIHFVNIDITKKEDLLKMKNKLKVIGLSIKDWVLIN